MGSDTKKDYTGDGPLQFTRLEGSFGHEDLRESPASKDMKKEAEESSVWSCYQVTTGEDMEDFVSCSTVNYGVFRSV
jgi:hypothetical protein